MTNRVIQTFYLDKTAFNNSDAVFVASYVLYFREIPDPINNVSGIKNPGVTIALCDLVNGVPDVSTIYPDSITRMLPSQVQISPDGGTFTGSSTNFPTEVCLATNRYYGLVITLDDPGFVMWFNKKGDPLVGTNQPSPGATGQHNGNYYEYTSSGVLTPLTDRSLKYIVYNALFTANSQTYDLVPDSYEFLSVYGVQGFFYGGEFVYQDFTSPNTTFYCNGTISVSSSNAVVIGTGTSFTSLFANGDPIVITDGTGANTMWAPIASVTNNTVMTLSYPVSFSNTAAHFKKTVSALVYNYNPLNNELILHKSTANSTNYFNDSGVLGLTITAGGTSYVNGDIITVSNGSVNAKATATTNSTGGISSANFSNAGHGFVNATAVAVGIANSTGGATTGSGATITVTAIGSGIVGLASQAMARLVTVNDWSVDQFDSEIVPTVLTDTNVAFTYVFSNTAYGVNTSNFVAINNPGNNHITYNGIIASRSHEVLNPANLYPEAGDPRSAVIKARLTANASTVNLYKSPYIHDESLDFYVYQNLIANTTTNEHLPQGGDALARHITTSIALANTAEDLIVYVDAWAPVSANLHVYGKVWNHNDRDPIAKKYWTKLVQVDPPIGVHSSSANTSDFITYTYKLPPQPPSNTAIPGVALVGSGSATVNGTGTSFSSNLAVGQIIKIYDPLQPNTNYFIAVVNSIANATQMTIDTTSTNNSIIGNMAIDTLQYGYAAFTNPQNSNIARYYTSANTPVDGYDNFAVKIVMTSNNTNVAPLIKDIRGIAVSA